MNHTNQSSENKNHGSDNYFNNPSGTGFSNKYL